MLLTQTDEVSFYPSCHALWVRAAACHVLGPRQVKGETPPPNMESHVQQHTLGYSVLVCVKYFFIGGTLFLYLKKIISCFCWKSAEWSLNSVLILVLCCSGVSSASLQVPPNPPAFSIPLFLPHTAVGDDASVLLWREQEV